jgi:hypothetical protein
MSNETINTNEKMVDAVLRDIWKKRACFASRLSAGYSVAVRVTHAEAPFNALNINAKMNGRNLKVLHEGSIIGALSGWGAAPKSKKYKQAGSEVVLATVQVEDLKTEIKWNLNQKRKATK